MIGGRFEVLQLTRRDFTGTVYSALDIQSQRNVECLLINLSAEDTHHLLELRAHTHDVKKLKLKSFASTYGIGKQGVDGYLVRQNIEGRPLIDHLKHRSQNHRPFKQRGLCSLLIEMIQSLEALESQEVSISEHGLIRPNIVMIQNQSKPRVRITDLGLGSLRQVLVKNTELDQWTQGCVPELRGEPTPQDPDLYALGALLFQMTQLRPFTKGWLRELSVSPTFSQLPDLIEACTASDPLITLSDLKSELKYAAQSQVESGGLTRDLSQLQERLQKIIHYESGADSSSEPVDELPFDPQSEKPTLEIETEEVLSQNAVAAELIPQEASVSVVFDELPSDKVGYELSETEPLLFTPMPTAAYTTTEVASDKPQTSGGRAAPHLAPEPLGEDQDELSAQEALPDIEQSMREIVERGHSLLSSDGHPQVVRSKHNVVEVSEDQLEVDMSALNDIFDGQEMPEMTQQSSSADGRTGLQGLEMKIETLHGVDLEELDDEDELQVLVGRDRPLPTQIEAPSLPPIMSARGQGDIGREQSLGQEMSSIPLPIPALSAELPYDDDLIGQRWIVVRDGIDYGPYTLDELSHQLFREEINLETEVCDIETDHRAALGEFSSLEHVLNEWAKERLARRQQKVEFEQRAKVRRRVTLIALLVSCGFIVFIGLSYGPQIRAAMLPEPANVDLNSWVGQAPEMKVLKRLKENPSKRAERARLKRAQKARLETLRDAKAMAREAREAAEATSVDFNRRGAKRSRFSRSEFDKALSNRSERLFNCIEAEHRRSPERGVLKVTMTVQRSGRFLNARLVDGSGPGVKCVFRAIQGLKMPPFSGGDKTITLPYKVK